MHTFIDRMQPEQYGSVISHQNAKLDARPNGRSHARSNARQGFAMNILTIFAGSLILALMAQISIPFQPVPFTLQTFAVFLLGGILGSRRGALAVIAYLAEGAIGLPVFAHGTSGFFALIGPTGGYLISFVVAAFLIGFFMERGWKNHFFLTLLAIACAAVVILMLGSLWLSMFIGLKGAAIFGVLPFILSDAAKVLMAAAVLSSSGKFFRA